MGLILWECLFTIGFNPSSGNNKNKAACFKGQPYFFQLLTIIFYLITKRPSVRDPYSWSL